MLARRLPPTSDKRPYTLGDLDRADESYRRAAEFLDSFDRDSMASFFPALNLAAVSLERAQYAEVLELGGRLREHPACRFPYLAAVLDVLAAAGHAGLGRWEEWERFLARVERACGWSETTPAPD